jgi:flagellar protein FlaF
MQNAAQAYAKVAKQIVNPRELEADLLLKAASRLQTIVDGWDRKKSELDAALLYNRKLWSIFMISATNTEHALPVGIRQNIANLGLFVMNQTMSMMANQQARATQPLIGINRELAAGIARDERRNLAKEIKTSRSVHSSQTI